MYTTQLINVLTVLFRPLQQALLSLIVQVLPTYGSSKKICQNHVKSEVDFSVYDLFI